MSWQHRERETALQQGWSQTR